MFTLNGGEVGMDTLDIKKYLESSLNEMIINKQGEILGMTKGCKNIINENGTMSNISDIFDDALFKKIQLILEKDKNSPPVVQEMLTGKLKNTTENNTTCSIIYQQESEKAIINLKVDEEQKVFDHLYESAFQCHLTPLAIINEFGFFVSVNDAFTTKFSNVMGGRHIHLKTFLDTFDHEVKFSYKEYFDRAKKEAFVQTKSSFEFFGDIRQINILMQMDPKTKMFTLKIVDITEHEQLLNLLAHSDQLSMTGEIAASIAHEVRNPMTTLQGFLQLLEHEVTGNAHKYVMVIKEEVLRMNEILNEMLSLAKPTVAEVSDFELSVTLHDVLTLLRPKALLDQINIMYEIGIAEPVFIHANPHRMKQVFVNLLKNAMEAMEPHDTLGIHVCEGAEQTVEILISDTGSGMSEELMDQIFLPFISEKVGGTGLGLPFVKKTVNEYGGTISVTSEVGKGSVFKLTFPRIHMNLHDAKSILS